MTLRGIPAGAPVAVQGGAPSVNYGLSGWYPPVPCTCPGEAGGDCPAAVGGALKGGSGIGPVEI